MSLLSKLSQRECWESFYKYKSSLIGGSQLVKELRSFIDSEKYIPVYQRIISGEAFPLPRKSVISKLDTQKKRVVYTICFLGNTTGFSALDCTPSVPIKRQRTLSGS